MATVMRTAENAVESESTHSRSRRVGSTAAEIRELKKMFVSFMLRLDKLLKTEVGRIMNQMNLAIEASQRDGADVEAVFEKLRSDLNQLTGGMAEQLVRKCGDEAMLERFRRCGWRV